MVIARRTLAIVGGVLLLVLGVVAAVVATLDLNQFVGPVLARIKAATGREVTVGGDVRFKFGLTPRIVADDVRLANAPWAKGPYLMTAKHLEMQVALLPLLQRRFELVRLNVVEPVITLETAPDGRNNWDLGDAPRTAAPPAIEAKPGAFALGDLEVSKGELTYRDASGGAETQVKIDEFSLEAPDRQSRVKTEFKGTVDGTAVSLAGEVGPIATLLDRGTPYPVSLKGEVADRKTAVGFTMRRDGKGVALEGIDAVFGSSNVKGKVDIRDAGSKSTWTVNLTSTSLDLDELTSVRGTAPAAKPAAAGSGTSPLVFSDTPVSFDALHGRNASGEIAVDRLTLSGGHKVERIRSRFTLTDGKLEAPSVQVAGYGGTIAGSISIDATRGKPPVIALKLDGRDLNLAALLAVAGEKREVRGGKTAITIDVAMRGNSPHQWMSGIGGRAQAVVGPATLVNTKLDPGLTFDRLAEAINPFRTVKPSTDLTCAVVRLPLSGGVAQVDRSIALETKEIDVSMSGKLDFRNETLDLSIRPRVRQGISIEIPQIAELVRFTGPFAAPTVSVDAVASATAIARVGAAIGTGGLSVLGETLLAGASSGAGACEVALGKAGTSSAVSSTTPSASSNPIEGIGNALKGLFQR